MRLGLGVVYSHVHVQVELRGECLSALRTRYSLHASRRVSGSSVKVQRASTVQLLVTDIALESSLFVYGFDVTV